MKCQKLMKHGEKPNFSYFIFYSNIIVPCSHLFDFSLKNKRGKKQDLNRKDFRNIIYLY